MTEVSIQTRPALSNAQRKAARKSSKARSKWEAETGTKAPEKPSVHNVSSDDCPIEPATLKLSTNRAVVVNTDMAGRITRARRQDVFDLFHARGKLGADAYQAVRRLQDDIAVLHRTVGGGGDFAPRVDRSSAGDGFNDARIKAGERIFNALDRAGASSAKLLVAICEPAVIEGRGADWREVVTRITGERLPDAQGAILRVACENLAGAYRSASKERP